MLKLGTQPSTVFSDKRNVEIGRTTERGEFRPAKPGLCVGEIKPDKYVKLETVDWEYLVYKAGGNLEAAARKVFINEE